MTNNEEIVAIANQLAKKGVKPTVALIKTKLTNSVPLPTIIQVLKTWQFDPDHETKSASKEEMLETKASQDKSVEAQIQDAIAPLMLEIQELKAQIQKLIERS